MNTVVDMPDWRKLSQEERDRAFNNSAAVVDSASIVAGWDRRSADIRARYPEHIGIEYGPRERNRIDFLKAKTGAPTLVFIHGGYWQARAKENFTFCAAGPMAHDINVALIGYTLAPEATLDQIVAEVRSAIDHLAMKLPSLGGNPDKIIVSGWSAGGHLSSMVLAHPRVSAALLISGVYDLEPIRHTYLNTKLGLDEAAARRNSSILQIGGVPTPVAVVAGSSELPLLRQQSADYAAHRAKQRFPIAYEEIANANHFTIMDELESPDGRLTTLIRGFL
jgi:acetyl esterase/lipase